MKKIQYALFHNPLTNDPNGFMAVVQNQQTIDMDRLVDDIVAEGTGLTRPQALAYNEKLFQLIGYYAGMGYRVSLPVATFRASIKGVFNGEDDVFDSSRHQLLIRTTPGARIRSAEQAASPMKVKSGVAMPEPRELTDMASGEKNMEVTPGNIAVLRGYNLKFNPADTATGVFLVPVDDPASPVRMTQYSSVKNMEVHFLVPSLKAGDYRVEVRAVARNGKTLRSGQLDDIIGVA